MGGLRLPRTGVEYINPDRLRIGHAVDMMRRVLDMKQFKSLSQHLMHSSVAINGRG